MSYVYLTAFLISIVLGMLFLQVGQKQNVTTYALLCMCICVSSGGYALLAFSPSVQWAIVSNIVAYFGNYFAMLFLLMCLFKLTDLKISPLVYVILGSLNCVIVGFVSTVHLNEWFYKDIQLCYQAGAYNLEKLGYGPVHLLHYLLLASYIILSFGVTFYLWIKKRKASFKNIFLLLTSEILILLVYVIEIFATNIKLELVPFAMVAGEAFILVCIWRLGMYDVSGHIVHTLSKREDHGYLVLDKHFCYIGSDKQAEEFFPRIREMRVDHSIVHQFPEIFSAVSEWIQHTDVVHHVTTDSGLDVRCDITPIKNRRKVRGYLVEFFDDSKQVEHMRLLNHYNEQLRQEVDQEVEKLSQIQQQMILGMATLVEKRDQSTGNHIKRTSYVVRILTNHLNRTKEYDAFPENYWLSIIRTAPLHDIGKITIDDAILRKPGKYLPEEFEIMKKHAVKGSEIVREIMEGIQDQIYKDTAQNIAKYHHERWDGKGYPEHLSGIQIPLEARIMAIADVLDALVSKRCYKNEIPFVQAVEIIRNSFGTQFDPSLRNCFEDSLDELSAFYAEELTAA